MRFPRLPIVFFLFLILSAKAFGFSAPNVPIDDPVYRDIDKLASFGLVPDLIYGQRPWSRSEISRIIATADKNKTKLTTQTTTDQRILSAIDELLTRLKADYREELVDQGVLEGEVKSYRFHPLHYVDTEYTFLHSEPRKIPADNGLGFVDAFVNPLTAYDEGRIHPKGHQLSVETEHFLRASRFFSFYARPRLQADIPEDEGSRVKPYVEQLYAKFTVSNFEIEAGRDSLIWGQGATGGLLLSNNARPLDMIKLANPSPLTLPWIFQYMGPFRYTFFIANLGPEREFPYSYLTGLKLTIKPVSFLELGIGQVLVLGGDGAPGPLTFENVVREFFLNRPGAIEDVNLSNRELGIDGRLWIPPLRNSQIYFDIQFEDKDYSSFMFTSLASYQIGLFIPRLDETGKMDLRLEYKIMAPIFYRHYLFTKGMSLNQKLWGDPLGPDGNGFYAVFTDNLSPQWLLSTSFQYEKRDADIVAQLHNPSKGEGWHYEVLQENPDENRFLWKVGTLYRLKSNLSLSTALGYERVQTFNFKSGDDRNGFLINLGLRYFLD